MSVCISIRPFQLLIHAAAIALITFFYIGCRCFTFYATSVQYIPAGVFPIINAFFSGEFHERCTSIFGAYMYLVPDKNERLKIQSFVTHTSQVCSNYSYTPCICSHKSCKVWFVFVLSLTNFAILLILLPCSVY